MVMSSDGQRCWISFKATSLFRVLEALEASISKEASVVGLCEVVYIECCLQLE